MGRARKLADQYCRLVLMTLVAEVFFVSLMLCACTKLDLAPSFKSLPAYLIKHATDLLLRLSVDREKTTS